MIRPTIASDLVDLAPRLRDADLLEIEALAGLGPLEALSVGLFHSTSCMTGVGEGGSIVAIFGVAPLKHGVGSVWLLTAPEVVEYRREILTTGRKWLDEQNALYPVLTNWVTESNDVHLRLIKHLGFKLGETITIGTVRAIHFERRR